MGRAGAQVYRENSVSLTPACQCDWAHPRIEAKYHSKCTERFVFFLIGDVHDLFT